jgi:hypothetical protein
MGTMVITLIEENISFGLLGVIRTTVATAASNFSRYGRNEPHRSQLFFNGFALESRIISYPNF